MTWEELKGLEGFLEDNGYIKNPIKDRQGDYYWWKAFGKGDNPYDNERPLWWVELNVFDWRKWQGVDKEASVTVSICVSRIVDETPIWLEYDLKNDIVDLMDIENKAYCFYQYVNDYFNINNAYI